MSIIYCKFENDHFGVIDNDFNTVLYIETEVDLEEL